MYSKYLVSAIRDEFNLPATICDTRADAEEFVLASAEEELYNWVMEGNYLWIDDLPYDYEEFCEGLVSINLYHTIEGALLDRYTALYRIEELFSY